MRDGMRVLSGMQPSGNPHLGNYLGAMKHHVELAENPRNKCFYCIVDLHALTTVRNAENLRTFTRELALDYLSLGLDPNKAVFFRQSDVPEHVELCWILSTVTSFGLLERAHAWKDAIARDKKDTTAGLFTYPVLMAADILLYQPDKVPVGQDQKQHIEICRDIAQTFNHIYGKTFVIPEPMIRDEVAVIVGTDGQKMSKSYGNVIEIFADGATLKKQVFSMKTDSKGVSEPKDPKTCIPYLLYAHFAQEDEKKELESRLREGGLGYAELKQMLLDRLLAHFAQARECRLELEKKKGYVEDVLQEGTKKARKTALETMDKVREKCGLG